MGATDVLDIAIRHAKVTVIQGVTLVANTRAITLVTFIVRNHAQIVAHNIVQWDVVKDVQVLALVLVVHLVLEMQRLEVVEGPEILVEQVDVMAVAVDARQLAKGDVREDVVLAAVAPVKEAARTDVRVAVREHVRQLVLVIATVVAKDHAILVAAAHAKMVVKKLVKQVALVVQALVLALA